MGSPMSRKDSKGMFANVLGQMQAPAPAIPTQAPNSQSPHLKKVADGIRQMQERGEILDRLLKEGDRIAEIDVEDIAQSAIQDRFEGAYDDSAMAEMLESIRQQGQIVPGLVRPTSDGIKPFQIVYGRRRLAAAKALGLKFRAIVKDLTDEQAIIYQGEENTNRDDLTFIEKCSFALAQQEAGFNRDVICASLSTGKSHISEMIRIATTVPGDILRLIGRSPDTGRRRWMEFVEHWHQADNADGQVRAALAYVEDGADRFALALNALKTQQVKQNTSSVHEIEASGLIIGTLAHAKSGSKINFNKSVPTDFAEFIAEQLPLLHAQYLKKNRKE